jgi:hypothetical protein
MSSNIDIKETEKEIVLTIKKEAPLIPSKSGKSMILGTTSGFIYTQTGFGISANVITKK